jgi:ParB/RepB/Spo0J family partition protein
MQDRKFKLVPAGKIHPSSLLPLREYGLELEMSVGRIGVQQPIIVRPLLGKSEEYEAIDGQGRLASLKDDQKILVDIRYNIKDSEVFRISEATFQRKDRSAYERALFYAEWVKTLKEEKGTDEGIQALIARETNLSESAISQYIAIYTLFSKLESLAPSEKFNALKTWSVNKLYKLSELAEDPNLPEIAEEFEKKDEVSVEDIEQVVTEKVGSTNEIKKILDSMGTDTQSDTSSADALKQDVQAETKNECVKFAKRVRSMSTETHQSLNTLVEDVLINADVLSSNEILDIFDKVLRTLRKLKRHLKSLHKKVEP